MAQIPGTIGLTGAVAPRDDADTYAVSIETYNRGGYRTVADLTARDAITVDRRKEGMLVRVISESKYYILEGGITNGDWAESFKSEEPLTVAAEFHIATTGSDTTGDGTVGTPYFSPHKCLEMLPQGADINANVTILAAAGNYDFTGLDDLIFTSKGIGGVKIYIKPETGVNQTVLDSGTFTGNTDFIHTDSGKSWTIDEYAGKLLHLTAGQSVAYTGISEHTETALTAITYNFTNEQQSWSTYEIIEPSVHFDLGSNMVKSTSYSSAYVDFSDLKITAAKVEQSFVTNLVGASTGAYGTKRCIFVVDDFMGENTLIEQSTLTLTGFASGLPRVYNSTITTTGTTVVLSASFKTRRQLNGVILKGGGSKSIASMMSSASAIEEFSNVGFINAQKVISTLDDISLFGKVYFKDVDFFMPAIPGSSAVNPYPDYYSIDFETEPDVGRLTLDWATEAALYADLDANYNYLAIAPDSYVKGIYTSNLTYKRNIVTLTDTDLDASHHVTLDTSYDVVLFNFEDPLTKVFLPDPNGNIGDQYALKNISSISIVLDVVGASNTLRHGTTNVTSGYFIASGGKLNYVCTSDTGYDEID